MSSSSTITVRNACDIPVLYEGDEGYIQPHPDRTTYCDTSNYYLCTLARGHEGDHAAHGDEDGRVPQYARWPQDMQDATPAWECCADGPEGYLCTLPMDHGGDHVAHILPNLLPVARWEQGVLYPGHADYIEGGDQDSDADNLCHVSHEGDGFGCTLLRGHDGDHAAHGYVTSGSNPQYARWTDDESVPDTDDGEVDLLLGLFGSLIESVFEEIDEEDRASEEEEDLDSLSTLIASLIDEGLLIEDEAFLYPGDEGYVDCPEDDTPFCCDVKQNGLSTRFCTLAVGHDGPHVAHGRDTARGTPIVDSWDQPSKSYEYAIDVDGGIFFPGHTYEEAQKWIDDHTRSDRDHGYTILRREVSEWEQQVR